MTSNEETVFWKPLVVVCEHLKKKPSGQRPGAGIWAGKSLQ